MYNVHVPMSLTIYDRKQRMNLLNLKHAFA